MTFVHKPTFLRSAVLEDPLGWGELLTPQDILIYETKFPELFTEALPKRASNSQGVSKAVQPIRSNISQRRPLPRPGSGDDLNTRLQRRPPDLNRLTELSKPARCSRDRCHPEYKLQGKGDARKLGPRNQRPRSSPSKPLSIAPVIMRSKSVTGVTVERKNFIKSSVARAETVLNSPPMQDCRIMKLQHSFSAEAGIGQRDSRKPVLLYRKSRSHPGRLSQRFPRKTYEVEQREIPRKVTSHSRRTSPAVVRKRRDLLKQVDILKRKVQQSWPLGQKTLSKPRAAPDADTKAKLMNIFTDTLMRSFKSPKSVTSYSTARNTSVVRFSDESFLSSVGESGKREPFDDDKDHVLGRLSDIKEEQDVSHTTTSSSISSISRSIDRLVRYDVSGNHKVRYTSQMSREYHKSQKEEELTIASVSKCEQLLLTNILASKYAKEGKFHTKKNNFKFKVSPLLPTSQQLLDNLERQQEKQTKSGETQTRMLEQIANELIYAEVMKIIEEEKHSKIPKKVKRKSVATATSFEEKEPIARVEQCDVPKLFASVGVETSFSVRAAADYVPNDPTHSTMSSVMSMSPFITPSLTPPPPLYSFPKAKPEFLQLLMGGSGRFLRTSNSDASSLMNPKTPAKTEAHETSYERSGRTNQEITDCSELEDFVASTGADPSPNLRELATPSSADPVTSAHSNNPISNPSKATEPAQYPQLPAGHTNGSKPPASSTVIQKSLTHLPPNDFDLSELETSINSILGSIISEGELVLKNLQLDTGTLKSPGEVSSDYWPFSPGLHLSTLMQDLDLSDSLLTPSLKMKEYDKPLKYL